MMGPNPCASFLQKGFTGCEVHLWYLSSQVLGSWSEPRLYAQVLCQDEIEKLENFAHRPAAIEFLIGRLLVRHVLSRYYPRFSPRQWIFEFNQFGKPRVTSAMAQIEFNLSHSSGWVVCALTNGFEVGIDIEGKNRRIDFLDMAKELFSPLEEASLRDLSPTNSRELFYKYWTLKEAYIKARGIGLTLPMDQFSFLFGRNERAITVSFGNAILDDPHDWWFRLLDKLDLQVALAVANRGRPVRLVDCGELPLTPQGSAVEPFN
jgi:4'-phosphopantetheinyl transferase